MGKNTGSVRLRRVGRFTHANQDHPTLPSIGSTGSTAKARLHEAIIRISTIAGKLKSQADCRKTPPPSAASSAGKGKEYGTQGHSKPALKSKARARNRSHKRIAEKRLPHPRRAPQERAQSMVPRDSCTAQATPRGAGTPNLTEEKCKESGQPTGGQGWGSDAPLLN